MHMIMFVLKDRSHLEAILKAWGAVGAGGVTIAETGHLSRRLLASPQVTWISEPDSYTLLTVVPDERAVRMCLAEVEEIVGDLDVPNTGMFVAWELSMVKGVPAQFSEVERRQ